jgi:plastocyanin
MTGRLRGMLMAGVALAAIAAAGCGTSAGRSSSGSASMPASGTATGQHVIIEGTNALKFSPMTVHVRTGPVSIRLRDMGAYPHNIVIPGLKVTSATVTGDPGGATTTFTVRFPHAGRYAFHCQYHQSAGMTGVFVVS